MCREQPFTPPREEVEWVLIEGQILSNALLLTTTVCEVRFNAQMSAFHLAVRALRIQGG